jgi:2,3-dihydroxybenzoate decarboxylase
VTRPSQQDYKYYFQNNVFITTSGNFSTPGLKFCVDELGPERCLFSIGMALLCFIPAWKFINSILDTPYDNIQDAQAWWRSVDIEGKKKEMIARENAIKLFKLPLEV